MILSLPAVSFAQDKENSNEELKAKAEKLFTSGDFKAARPMYSRLLSMYTKDPAYNYRYGACLVETNADIPKAIEYLTFAAAKGVEERVRFYLGKANHLSYNFETAIKFYEEFKSTAKKTDLDELQVDWHIQMCKNGMDLVKYVSDLKVLENKVISEENFYYSYELNDFGGSIIVMPDEYKSKLDKKAGEKQIMFLSEKHGVIYYSSLGDKKGNGKDIFRLVRSSDGKWSVPENLGPIINTNLDEDYPFINPDGKTLYFCSKGHESMGGFDVFRSVFDSVESKWTAPVNLDFPTNTPYDDILYICDAEGDFAYFASNRETSGNEISVYKIAIDKNPIEKQVDNIQEIIQKSKLEVNTTEAELLAAKNDGMSGISDPQLSSRNHDVEFAFADISLTEKSTPEEVIKVVNHDREVIELDAENTKNDANVFFLKANELNMKADDAKNKADAANNAYISETNPIAKEEKRQEYLKQKNEADKAKREAITAYKLADNLDKAAKEKLKLAEKSSSIEEKLNSGEIDTQTALKNVQDSRDNTIASQNKFPTIQNEIEKRQVSLKDSRDRLSNQTKTVNQISSKLELLKEDIRTVTKQIDSGSGDRAANQKSLSQYLSEFKKLDEERITQVALQKELEQEIANTSTEVALLQDIQEESKKTDSGLQEEINKIDINALASQINTKELEVDESFANNIVEATNEEKASTKSFLKEVDITDIDATLEDLAMVETIKNSTSTESSNTENSSKITPSVLPERNYNNPESAKLYNQAKNDMMISDSLAKAVEEKKRKLPEISNEMDRSVLMDEINELTDLAQYKKSQAEKAIQSADTKESESTLVAENKSENNTSAENKTENTNTSNVNVVKEAKDVNPSTHPAYFTDTDDNTVQTKYEKALFDARYHEQVANETKGKLALMKSSIDTVSNPKTKAAIEEKIKQMEEVLASNSEKANQNFSLAEEIKAQNKDLIEDDNLTDDELALKASKYTVEKRVPFTPDERQKLSNVKTEREKSDAHLLNYEGILAEINMLEASKDGIADPGQAQKIQQEIDKTTKELLSEFELYNTSVTKANTDEYDVYKFQLEKNKIVAEDENVKLANNLEKEADIFFEKASISRANAALIEDEKARTEELAKVSNLEKSAIEKQKHALDLYLTAIEQGIGEHPVASKEKNESSRTEITLLSEEEDQIRGFRENIDAATKLETESSRMKELAEEKKKDADKIYSEKEKEKLLAEATELENKAFQSNIDACKSHHKADSLKYNLYNKQIKDLSSTLTEVGNNKSIAGQYMKEADFYFTEAQKIYNNAEKSQSLSEKENEYQRAKNFEKKALASQEIALDLMMEIDPVSFVGTNDLVKIDRLEALNQPVNVDMIKKFQEDKILNAIKLEEADRKALDQAKANKIESDNFLGTVSSVQEEIKTLEGIANSTEDGKTRKEALNKIPKLEKQVRDYKFAAQEGYQIANETKYWVFKENLAKVRTVGNSDKARIGKQLENEAVKSFNEAQRLRDKAFTIVDDEKAYEVIVKAKELEDLAIEKQHKAYGIYLGLPTIEEDSILYAEANRKEAGISEIDLIKTEANVTPLETNSGRLSTNNSDNELAMNTISENNDNVDVENISTSGNNDNAEANTVTENNTTENNTIESTNNNTQTESNSTETDNNNANDNNSVETGNNTSNETSTNNNNESSNSESSNTIASSEMNSASLDEITKMLIARGYGVSFDKNVKYSANGIPLNIELPGGIVYRIQVGAFKNPIDESEFNGISPMSKEKAPQSQWTKYLVGLFKTHMGARFALEEIVNMGYRDAFIVAYKDGKRVAFFQARDESTGGSQEDQDLYNLTAQAEIGIIKNRGKLPASGTSLLAESKTVAPVNNTTVKPESSTPNTADYVQPRKIETIEGLLYTVQIGVYKNAVTKKQLLNLDPILSDNGPNGLTRYTYGIFNDLNKANRERDRIREMGIRDAFVIAYRGGKRMTVSEARIVSENSGSAVMATPATSANSASANSSVQTGGDEIIFRVQIGAYEKDVPSDVVNSFIKVAANHGLDHATVDGITYYTVGKFTSYNEASRFKETLKSEGIDGPFIVAFQGAKKIDINKARELAQP